MKNKSLIFVGPEKVRVEPGDVPSPGRTRLLVKTNYSAVSAGTELLAYRGEFPEEMAVDSVISGYDQKFEYPLRYGYAAAGKVIEAGEDLSRDWLGVRVFAFMPHAGYFTACPEEIYLLPDDITEREAVFFPSMETAINIVQDAAPLLGEKAVVMGQGMVGLLTSHLLARFPLKALVAMDKYFLRRKASLEAGCHECLNPDSDDFHQKVGKFFQGGTGSEKADLVIELSGNPEVLNLAFDWVGFSGRLIIGSWYGKKKTPLNFGEDFHRKRVKIISSQVSTIAPELSGRWDKLKRRALTWSELKKIRPERYITHEFAIDEAERAFELLAKHPEQALQVVFRYDD